MKPFYLLLPLVLFISCEKCDSSSSCLAPPEGPFIQQNINFAFTESVLENNSEVFDDLGLLTSVSVSTNANVTLSPNFSWQVVDLSAGFSGFNISFNEEDVFVPAENLVRSNFSGELINGGYVVTFYRENDEYFALINFWGTQTSDWACEDTFDC